MDNSLLGDSHILVKSYDAYCMVVAQTEEDNTEASCCSLASISVKRPVVYKGHSLV